ncbi:MAG: hypothetical protein CMF05_03260 [Hyphomonas sp.]|uniref:hypothetical protein n=1 Tax=Hyphomonas sp. TaxID=87 RepID=UPI000C3C6ACB|nr:hypothetical protein [Hyphomonas sp.]MAM06491.1 hypothetical protein [Hyphomonas sp.]
MLRLGWIILVVYAAILIIATVRAIMANAVEPSTVDQPAAEHSEFSDDSAQEAKVRALRTLGYGEPLWVSETGNTGPANAATPQLAIQKKPPRQLRTGVIAQDIAATDPSGEDLLLRAYVLFDQRSWKRGSYTLFDGESPQGISAAKALRLSDLKTNLKNAVRVYCVGLASTEHDARAIFDNTLLSDNRSIRLCTSLVELGYVELARQKPMGLGLGEKVAELGSVSSPASQRAAIIIGVNKIGEETRERDVARAVLHGVLVNGVDLLTYHRSDRNLYKLFEVNSSTFAPADSE